MTMNQPKMGYWPSGDCRPVWATQKTPTELVEPVGLRIFRGRDALDWFTGATLRSDTCGPIAIMKHDGNPLGLTALYVDSAADLPVAENLLIQIFSLKEDDVAWRLSDELDRNL